MLLAVLRNGVTLKRQPCRTIKLCRIKKPFPASLARIRM
jgi:hypothetical protein